MLDQPVKPIGESHHKTGSETADEVSHYTATEDGLSRDEEPRNDTEKNATKKKDDAATARNHDTTIPSPQVKEVTKTKNSLSTKQPSPGSTTTSLSKIKQLTKRKDNTLPNFKLSLFPVAQSASPAQKTRLNRKQRRSIAKKQDHGSPQLKDKESARQAKKGPREEEDATRVATKRKRDAEEHIGLNVIDEKEQPATKKKGRSGMDIIRETLIERKPDGGVIIKEPSHLETKKLKPIILSPGDRLAASYILEPEKLYEPTSDPEPDLIPELIASWDQRIRKRFCATMGKSRHGQGYLSKKFKYLPEDLKKVIRQSWYGSDTDEEQDENSAVPDPSETPLARTIKRAKKYKYHIKETKPSPHKDAPKALSKTPTHHLRHRRLHPPNSLGSQRRRPGTSPPEGREEGVGEAGLLSRVWRASWVEQWGGREGG